MTRQVLHKKRRREAGKCGWEGCAAVTGDESFYCAKHAAQHRANKQAWRQRRKEAVAA